MSTPVAGQTLGERIRAARKRAGFRNQDDFATAVGTTRRNVVRWETDRHVPGSHYRERIAAVTGQADLFGDTDDEEDERVAA